MNPRDPQTGKIKLNQVRVRTPKAVFPFATFAAASEVLRTIAKARITSPPPVPIPIPVTVTWRDRTTITFNVRPEDHDPAALDAAALLRGSIEEQRNRVARQHTDYLEAGVVTMAESMQRQLVRFDQLLTTYEIDDQPTLQAEEEGSTHEEGEV